MKKIWLAVFCLLFLCSCGKEIDRAEEVQEQYKNLASYETDVHVCLVGRQIFVLLLHLFRAVDLLAAGAQKK